ncbi:MAG: hypothetical protein NWQ46_08935 [Spirosomaceae bacterium]|nr:hypothetical protein [Spirosomataceae bacterium]
MIDRNTFLNYINEPQNISLNDIMLLENMTKKHPFFQLGYSLIAKGIHSKAPDIANEAIKKAATYALSRNALRKVMENDIDWVTTPTVKFVEHIADEDAEITFTNFPIDNREDELIASIANNNLSGLVGEQLSIIDNFIKNQPRINKIDLSEQNDDEVVDLSVQSTVLSSPLYTESFARILIKQFKISEAKEVYETLMTKNPEKSAYFAAKIEEIKRKYAID